MKEKMVAFNPKTGECEYVTLNTVEYVDISTGEIFNYAGMIEQAESEYEFDQFTPASELCEYFDVLINGEIRYDVNFPYNYRQHKKLETMTI